MKRLTMTLITCALIGCGGDDDSFTATEPTVEETPACKENVTGQVTLVNGASSVQTATLNGVDHGKINTGSSITIDLPPGEYSLEFKWLDGSASCMPATINVSICSTQSLTCDG